MTTEWHLPGWARNMPDPPMVTSYSGDERLAIKWESGTSRRRFTIAVNRFSIDMNIAQAMAIRDMLDNAIANRPQPHPIEPRRLQLGDDEVHQ